MERTAKFAGHLKSQFHTERMFLIGRTDAQIARLAVIANILGIFLDENPSGSGDYRFDFAIDIPGLQLTYNFQSSGLSGTLNGQPFTTTPFSDGEASISAYYEELYVTVIGVLNNGKEFKLCVYAPY